MGITALGSAEPEMLPNLQCTGMCPTTEKYPVQVVSSTVLESLCLENHTGIKIIPF